MLIFINFNEYNFICISCILLLYTIKHWPLKDQIDWNINQKANLTITQIIPRVKGPS